MGQTCDTAKGTYGAGGKGPEPRSGAQHHPAHGGAQPGASPVPAAGAKRRGAAGTPTAGTGGAHAAQPGPYPTAAAVGGSRSTPARCRLPSRRRDLGSCPSGILVAVGAGADLPGHAEESGSFTLPPGAPPSPKPLRGPAGRGRLLGPAPAVRIRAGSRRGAAWPGRRAQSAGLGGAHGGDSPLASPLSPPGPHVPVPPRPDPGRAPREGRPRSISGTSPFPPAAGAHLPARPLRGGD